MTGAFWLDCALLAVSLFNIILLVWLGLTVLLNARRKSWGVWLAGGGLLLGGLFFVSHSAILGYGLHTASPGTDFWWHVGWVPVLALPLAWYVIMLWYAGFWERPQAGWQRSRRHGLYLVVLMAMGMGGLLLLANPLPSYWQVAQLELAATPSVAGIPLLILVYPSYVVLCIALSLDALRQMGSMEHLAEDGSTDAIRALARHRARPWLLAASIVLLLVGLLVGWVMMHIVTSAHQRALQGSYKSMAMTVAWFDLLIASLIAVSVVLLGQAIVSYEVFTGETLPRRGLFRHWRNAIILATGYSTVVAWSLIAQLRPIYVLLLSALLVTAFYALLSWRSFADRERYLERLRPFVASQRLHESLLAPFPSQSYQVDVESLLGALCEDVLMARQAYLIASGPLVSLAGPPCVYPRGKATNRKTLFALAEVAAQFRSPQMLCLPLDPSHYDALWAVSLWSERGLIGILALGDKQDGALYTREEIEIARASGERLLDIKATAEVSNRLMALVRQRIAEVKVLEGQGRRVLHDQVLPQLHAAVLHLSDAADHGAVELAMDALTAIHRQISDLMHATSRSAPLQLAQRGLIPALRTLVAEELDDFEDVEWHIEPTASEAVDRLPSFVGEVLFYAVQELIRNAARHGRGRDPQRPLRLKVTLADHDGLQLLVEDNGIGIDLSEGYVFPAGVSTNHGLQFHGTMLAAVGASLEVATAPTGGTRAKIALAPESLTEITEPVHQ